MSGLRPWAFPDPPTADDASVMGTDEISQFLSVELPYMLRVYDRAGFAEGSQ